MTRSYRSVLHRAGNTTSPTKSFPGERRGATRASRENVESSNPRFSLKASVCALLIAMGWVGYLNVASARDFPDPGNVNKWGSCERAWHTDDADEVQNWSCLAMDIDGSVGLINFDVTREQVEEGWQHRLAMDRDAVVIGRLWSGEEDDKFPGHTYTHGSISIGAKVWAEVNGVAIGKGAKAAADNNYSHSLYGEGRVQGLVRFPFSMIEDKDFGEDSAERYGAIAIGHKAATHIESDVVIGAHAGEGAQALYSSAYDRGDNDYWRESLGPSVIVGLDAGRNAAYRSAVLLGTKAGESSQGTYITAIGEGAAYGLNGSRNIAIGEFALGKMQPYTAEGIDYTDPSNYKDPSNYRSAEGDANLAVGSLAGAASHGSHNTFIGEAAGIASVGDHNIAMGANSGFLTQGSGNVLLGRHATGPAKPWDSGDGYDVSGHGILLNADTPYAVVNDAVSIGSESNVRGDNSVAIGHTSTADKAGVAIGTDATATTAGGVAIGKGAVEGTANPFASATIKGTTYQYAGIAPESVVSVGNAGAERQITNVAAGRISATSTDAINGSQLYAVHQAIENLTVSATNSAGGGSWNLQVNGDTPTAVEPSSTVGLNAGSNIQLARDGNTVSISTTPNIKVESVQADAVTAGTVSATDTLRVTDGPALTREGIDAANKTIVNVADGKKDHDAVNVAQLNQSARNLNERIDSISDGYNSRLNKVVSGLNNRIDRVAADADAGSATAGAMANLPQAHLPGENAFAIATAGYRGQQGYAAGLSRVSENGHWVVKGSLSGNNRGHMMYGAGIAYKW